MCKVRENSEFEVVKTERNAMSQTNKEIWGLLLFILIFFMDFNYSPNTFLIYIVLNRTSTAIF